MDESQSSKPKSKSMDLSLTKRTLLRRNAAKNFNFTPLDSSSTSPSTSSSSAPRTWSLDSPHALGMTSFRIDGKDGEVDWILQNLGLSGPEDLEIPKADYELLKNRSSPCIMQRPKKGHIDLNVPKAQREESKSSNRFADHVPHRFGNSVRTNVAVDPDSGVRDWKQHTTPPLHTDSPAIDGRGVGIKGDRPPLLTAPPPMTLPTLDDHNCSTWDLLEQLAPDSDTSPSQCHAHPSDDAETDGENAIRELNDGIRLGETVITSGSCSFTTSNDDDSSSTTTSIISPNGGGKIKITQWERGKLLGQGSFGTVYEGISSEGFFFAMKEVSLLEQGNQGKQSIYQLEQADSKLYIFLELVTQGSLASLYQKYNLRDSHVSAYTRQILMGLKYLHDRKVVHRDIKCANILVASNGTVKLADFGLAKATRLNDLKSCKGTAFWMAPEVINHKNNGYGMAADIWSLGCTVLEMLTRHIPYYPLELVCDTPYPPYSSQSATTFPNHVPQPISPPNANSFPNNYQFLSTTAAINYRPPSTITGAQPPTTNILHPPMLLLSSTHKLPPPSSTPLIVLDLYKNKGNFQKLMSLAWHTHRPLVHHVVAFVGMPVVGGAPMTVIWAFKPQALYRIGKGQLPPIPDYLSTEAQDFIQQCLRVNANDRSTAVELLDHQFVQRPLYIPFGSESPMMPDQII
ncbi:hypothetical protein KSS87_008262 [Heliosperma pusillum]|nr:hypothetical protein KSS87_008262 [Heliosperma pusillum]